MAYRYICGLPLGALLCFAAGLRLPGLWVGLTVGLALSVSVLARIILRMDWKAQADKAMARSAESVTGAKGTAAAE